MQACGQRCYDGACQRVDGHQGGHTSHPPTSTVAFDLHHTGPTVEYVEGGLLLLLLDWPSPPWADILENPS